MINFKFKERSDGYIILGPKGQVMYTCKNRTKETAFQEAHSFCSTFQGYCLEDTTFRLLNKFKIKRIINGKALRKELESTYPGQVRIKCVDFSIDGDTFEIEVWGTEDISNIWRMG
jgi:hypothetical protein